MIRVLLVLISITACNSRLLRDPRMDELVTGWRVPSSGRGASCGRSCNKSFHRCAGDSTVDASRAEACNNQAIACYERCPGVTTGQSVSARINVTNGRQACRSGLKNDRFHCFAYFPGMTHDLGTTYDP